MKSQVISLKRRISLVVLTIVMALSAVFGAIFLRGIFGDTAQTASADEFESYTVGATDNTTGYVGAKSTILQVKPGQKAVFSFVNHNNGKNEANQQWFNWLACVGSARGDSNILVLRADSYRFYFNGGGSNGITTENYPNDWTEFHNNLDGADCTATFSYVINSAYNYTLKVEVVMKTSNVTYKETFIQDNYNQNTYVFMSVDHNYLTINSAELSPINEYVSNGMFEHTHYTATEGSDNVGTVESHTMDGSTCSACGYEYTFKTAVGATNNTTGYLGDFSDKVPLTSGQAAVFTFKNYSAKGGNYQNWNACVATDTTNDPRTVVLRADNWENIQNNNTGISSNFDWDTFMTEMDGSDVVISFKFIGSSITIRADITATYGTTRYEEFTKTGLNAEGTYYVSLCVDHSHLVIDNIEVFEDNTDMGYNYDSSKHWKNSTVYSSSGIAVGTKTSHDGSPCPVCGYEGAIEHTYGDWTPDDATTHSRTCLDEDCDETETANHTFGAWSEKDSTYHSRTCSVCGYEETAAHTYDEYIYDSNSHWQICSVCNYNNEAEHIFTDGECVCGLEEDVMLVGTSDFSTGILGDYSDKFALTSGQVAVFTFKNYSSGTTNWDNWLACVGSAVGTPADLIVLRADSYEEKQGDGDGIDHNYADYSWWDYFATDMAASDVVVSFKYTGSAVTIRADMTANGHNRYEEFTKSELSGTIYVSLSVRFSYLAISSVVVKDVCISDGVLTHTRNTVTYSATDEVNGTEAAVHTLNENTHEGVCTDCGYTFKTTVGTRTTVDDVETYANSFFGDKSGVFALVSGETAVFKFTNNSAQVNKWDNWMVGVVNDTYLTSRNASDELVVLRADYFEQKQGNSNGIISNFVPEVFIDEVHEATIEVTVTYIDNSIAIRVDVTPNGAEKPTRFEKFTKTGISESVIYVFISGNASYQTITEAKVYTEQRYINYLTNSAGVSIPKDYVVAVADGHYYLPEILPTPLKNGYDFTNWTYNNTSNVVVAGAQLAGDNNRSIAANYSPISYTITYNLACGDNGEGNPATYTIESEAITLTAPTKPGYTFTGWTGSNGEETNTEVTIAAGSTGNKEYTANWVVEEGKESLKITEWNLLLSDRIGIRYHLNFANAEEAALYTLTFKINERTVTVSGSSGVANNYWYVFYINSLEMGDNATLSVYEGETEVIRHNAKSANAYFEQINGYTEEQRTAAGLSNKAVDLVNSLNDLGYYMQKANLTDGATHTDMPSEGVSSLSINDMYDEETTVVNHIISELSEEKFTKDHQEGVKASAISFTLSDQCVVNFRVTLEEGYEITATNNGSTYEKIDEENNIYVVKSQRIAPTNLATDQIIQITVSNGVNTSVSTLTASPMTYVRLALKSGSISDDIKLTLVAYYNYYNAAVTYQASVA